MNLHPSVLDQYAPGTVLMTSCPTHDVNYYHLAENGEWYWLSGPGEPEKTTPEIIVNGCAETAQIETIVEVNKTLKPGDKTRSVNLLQAMPQGTIIRTGFDLLEKASDSTTSGWRVYSLNTASFKHRVPPYEYEVVAVGGGEK